ncbi:MAG: metal ABC transporter permease [Ilumatobacteraceae bacterium]|nr:metal ABC transporter permease [Ilumatobacter sp.]MCO5329764.1 metal ABC transporter permease [Ilumatobacteraceae bacterium]
MISPFLNNPFMTRSLIAGILVAVSCSIAGTFVVLRGLAFLGDALAHGVLPGVAGALLLGAPGVLGAAVGAGLMIGGVNLVTRKSRLSSDTAIGLLFVGMLGLGVMMVSRSTSFTGDIVGILFGEILGVSRSDIVQQAIALVVVGVFARVFARPLLMLSFDPEQADIAGWPSRRFETLLLLMVTVCVVMSFQTVGTLLVFGMLLAPAGTGALIARRVWAMMAWGALFGSLSVWAGLLISYHFDLAAGASVVVVAVALFFVVFTIQAVRESLAQRRTGSVAPVG